MFYVEEKFIIKQIVDLFGDFSECIFCLSRFQIADLVELLVDKLYCVGGNVGE